MITSDCVNTAMPTLLLSRAHNGADDYEYGYGPIPVTSNAGVPLSALLLLLRVEAPEPLRQEGERCQGDGAIYNLAQRVPTGQDAKRDKEGGDGTEPQHRTGYEAMTAAAA